MHSYDKIIIGAGLYGLYSALFAGRNGEKVLVLEHDEAPFMRATYINQARVHMGYHYPRSYTTAIKSAGYYDQFHEDYNFCINDGFDKIYAVANNFSWTNAKQFIKFCQDSEIPCRMINPEDYFREAICEGAFVTKECTYDAKVLMSHMLEELQQMSDVEFLFNTRIAEASKTESQYRITLEDGQQFSTGFLLNATYASVNQVISKLGFEKIGIKYELCEVILCKVSDELKDVGITVMDGPFFSLMPFGQTGFHSLTAVPYTPHKTSHEDLPTFECQARSMNTCSPKQLGNCDTCIAKPKTAWPFMHGMAKKYLKEGINIDYVKSLYSIKPILKTSEIDDSRPTIIKEHSVNPTFVSVLSGKINTVYDLNDILSNGK